MIFQAETFSMATYHHFRLWFDQPDYQRIKKLEKFLLTPKKEFSLFEIVRLPALDQWTPDFDHSGSSGRCALRAIRSLKNIPTRHSLLAENGECPGQ